VTAFQRSTTSLVHPTAATALRIATAAIGLAAGATVSRARAYTEGEPHEVILFSPYSGDVVEDTTTLPSDWMVRFDANSDPYATVDTVACVEVKNEQAAKECTGYQDKGHDTNNTEHSGTDDSWPMVISFDNDTQTNTYDAPPSNDDVVAYLKRFVQP
jgi:hypothetical protein